MQLIESDIQAHQDQVDDIMAQVRAFREAGHFQIDQRIGAENLWQSQYQCVCSYTRTLSISSRVNYVSLVLVMFVVLHVADTVFDNYDDDDVIVVIVVLVMLCQQQLQKKKGFCCNCTSGKYKVEWLNSYR